MLNRTNLTLSALSNRLNLGTRSLARTASVNHGAQPVRIRHLHSDHDVMRDRMVWYVVSSFPREIYVIPLIPGSIIPGPQQRLSRWVGQGSSQSACERSGEPETTLSWLLGQAGCGHQGSESRSTRPAVKPAGTRVSKRRPGRCPRLAGFEGLPAAARQAATAGSAAAPRVAVAEA